jgi:hypothetical protein
VVGGDARPLPNGAQVDELEDERAQSVTAPTSDVAAPVRVRVCACLHLRTLFRASPDLRPARRRASPAAHAPRYPSTITPSAAYLGADERARACGTPKPFVKLVGPSLTVALNARGAGGEGDR